MSSTAVKILIVEDEAILAMDLADTLTAEGYQVVGMAGDGETALQLYRQQTPDLVICDIQIQGPDNGVIVVQKMVTIRPLPVIYLTAFTDGPTFEQAKTTRPAAYLVKPYQLLNLRAAIELALHQFAALEQPGNETVKSNVEEEITIGRETILRIDEAIFVKQDGGFTKIPLSEVLYVMADGNYVVIQTTTIRYALRLSLASFLEKVNYSRLVRTHRSYAVNVSKVDQFSDQELTINKSSLPLSRQYRDAFLRSFVIR